MAWCCHCSHRWAPMHDERATLDWRTLSVGAELPAMVVALPCWMSMPSALLA